MSESVSDDLIAAVRAFNRFYTKRLGVLEQHLLGSPFSLAEARVLYELAHRDNPAAKTIGAELGLDAGYLSRIIQNFQDQGLIVRQASAEDRRQYRLSLTTTGRQAFGRLDRGSQDEVAAMLRQLPPGSSERLVQAMATMTRLLGAPAHPPRGTAARPSPRRHGLGGAEPRHVLCGRLWLRFLVREPGGGNRCKIPRFVR